MATATASAVPLHTAPPGRVLKARAEGARRVARGFVTLEERDADGQPVRDYDGDFVVASGAVAGDAPLFVNWHHGVVIGSGDPPVRKAVRDEHGNWTEGLDGTSYIATTAADLDGVDLTRRDRNGNPVGTWAVKDCLDAAEDVWPLIRDQLAPGLSLEFTGLSGGVERGRKSFVSGRDQRVFRRYVVHGWAHTPQPTNRMANLFEPEQVEKAWRDVAERGRSELVRKSFSDALAALRLKPSAVPVTPHRSKKAMDENDPMADAAVTDAPPPEAQPAVEDDTPPTAKAAYDAAQGCEDLASMIEDAVKKSEHVKGKAKILKLVEKLRSISADANAVAEMVLGDVGGGDAGDDGDTDFDAEDGPDEPDDDDPTEKAFTALEKGGDGVLVFKSAYRPRRFKASDLRDPPAPKDDTPADAVVYTAAEHDALMAGIDELKKLLPKART